MAAVDLTFAPAGARARDIIPDTDPATGVLTFTAPPGRHTWVLGQAALAGLGVRRDLRGGGRALNEDLTLLRCWLAAHQVVLIVVRHASNLTRGMFDVLLALTDGTDAHTNEQSTAHPDERAHAPAIQVALTCDETVGEDVAAWVIEHGGGIHDSLDWLDALRGTRSRVTGSEEPAGPSFPRVLPQVDFYLWRARCRDVLSPRQFEVVDDLFRDVYAQVALAPFETDQAASAFLSEAFKRQGDAPRALTVARAAQAAMFAQHGQLLKVDLERLMPSMDHGSHRRLTTAEVMSLRAYRNPLHAAVTVLRDADLTRAQIRALTVDDARLDASTLCTPLPLHSAAHVYLRAQRLLRLSEGAGRGDLLFGQAPRALSLAARQAASDLALPTVPARESRRDARSDRWRHRLGVTMRDLVGPIAQPKPGGKSIEPASVASAESLREEGL